jgi:hypothetical protein
MQRCDAAVIAGECGLVPRLLRRTLAVASSLKGAIVSRST